MHNSEKVLIGCIVGVVLLWAVLTYVKCGKEAEFYTKLTGVEVTRSDAFWLDLDPSKHVIQVEQGQQAAGEVEEVHQ